MKGSPLLKRLCLLLNVWNKVLPSSCDDRISEETFAWPRNPLYLWFVAPCPGPISHDAAWCQMSFICSSGPCPLLPLNPSIVGILSATSVCGNTISSVPPEPELVRAGLWLSWARSKDPATSLQWHHAKAWPPQRTSRSLASLGPFRTCHPHLGS